MANIKAAKKKIRVIEKKTLYNKRRSSEIKTYIKKFENAVTEKNLEQAREILKVVDRKLKKAMHKNLFHKNKVARKMSKLQTKLNSINK